MIKQKNIKKKLFTAFIVLEIIIFSGMPNFAQAFLFGSGNVASEFATEAVNKFIPEEIRDFAKISDKKTLPPRVKIRSNNFTPKPGEEVTVSAEVEGILNPDTAYYTWYLKREGDENDVEVWKKNAIQETINMHFDPLVFDQKFNGGNQNGVVDDFEWEQNDSDGDDDAYISFNGGDDNKGAGEDQYYYIYDKESGEYFEIGRIKSGKYEEGDDLYEECGDDHYPACMIQDRASKTCPILDTPVSGEATSSSDGGSGGDSGSGGDGGSSSASTVIEEEDSASGLEYSRCANNGSPVCSSDGIKCPYGGVPYCVPKPSTDTGHFFLLLNDDCPDPYAAWDLFISGEVGGASCEDYLDGGFLEELECEMEPAEEDDFKPFNGPTFHLFPVESYNAEDEPQPFGMPDNEFNLDSEIYWGTDPRSTSTTNNTALNDEALIVGLGVQEFTWKYQPGDEIGVVVEGKASVPTKHRDGTYQSVFAFMDKGCKPRKKGAYVVNVEGEELLIRTATMDPPMLNDCLTENLMKLGVNEHEGLSVSMAYSDDVTQAVTSGEGQSLTFDVRALMSESGGMIDTSKLHYNWKITCGDTRATVCKEGADITGSMREGGNLSKTLGDNLHSVNISSNFPDSCFNDGGRGYACVSTQVNTDFSQDTSAYGRGEMIVPIQKSGGRLKAFSTTSDGNSFSTKEEICKGTGMDFSLCRVVRGEIIGVEMPMPDEGTGDLISWTINGRPYSCNGSVSSECGDASNTNKIFFPVVNPIGDTITVNANYNNPTEGEFANKTVSRSFVIVEPEVHIEPTSGGNFKTLGKYIDASGDEFEEKSWRTIEVASGNSVALKAVFTPRFIEGNSKLEWSFNGEKSYENTLQVVPNLPANVSLKALYRPSNTQALVNLFGINQFNISDSHLSTSVRLIEGNKEDLSSKDKAVGFFATAASNTPAYFYFMLKMVLMVSAMLFVSHLVLSMASYNNRRF